MSADGVLDTLLGELTPRPGNGALGAWRVLGRSGHRAGISRALKWTYAHKSTMSGRGVDASAFKLRRLGEGRGRICQGQNRTREIRPSGIAGGLAET
jgi:hypothetical protein